MTRHIVDLTLPNLLSVSLLGHKLEVEFLVFQIYSNTVFIDVFLYWQSRNNVL